MDRPTHQEGIRIDWDFVDARDAANAKRIRDAKARKNLAALRSGVKDAKIGPELSEFLWEQTRNRILSDDDKKEVFLLARQGFDNRAIGCALELTQDRVREALV
jgi:hypothetical protein